MPHTIEGRKSGLLWRDSDCLPWNRPNGTRGAEPRSIWLSHRVRLNYHSHQLTAGSHPPGSKRAKKNERYTIAPGTYQIATEQP